MSEPPERAIDVLVIEDNDDDFARTARHLRALRPWRCSATRASDLDTAERLLPERQWDAVLLDEWMQGESALDRLGTSGLLTQLPSILLTGEESEELQERAAALGALDVLRKDEVNERSLTRAIRFAMATNQRRALLEQERAFHKAVFFHSRQHMAILDDRGTIIDVNPAWEAFARRNGLTHPRAGRGMNYLQVCRASAQQGDRDALDCAERLQELLDGRAHTFVRVYPCHAPDEERWFEVRMERLEMDGHVRLMIAHEDMTSRHLAARALRASNERYRLIGRATKDITWDWDLVTNRVQWGEAITAMGYAPHVLGDTITQWYDLIHPDDRARVVTGILEAVKNADESWSDSYRFLRADGTDALVLDRGYLLLEDGQPVRMIGAMTDLSEWKAAEDRIRFHVRLLDQVEQAVVVSDPANRITFWNGCAERLYGWSAAEALGRRVRDVLLPPEEAPRAADAMRLVREGSSWHGETTAVRKDGERIPVYVSSTPILDDAGRLVAVAGVSFDLTERKRLEAQLRQAQKMEAVGLLAGGVAHDFNNILSVITVHADLLLECLPTDDPRRDDVAAIEDASRRATELTRQLLAFSRQQIMRPTLVELDSVVRSALRMLGRLLGEDIELVADLPEQPLRVEVDRGQMDQILMNLAVNARDAMPNGGRLEVAIRGATITSHTRRPELLPPGDYVVLTVRDSGVGMDRLTQSRIFEPFFTTKEAGRGTGLGLATVYGIVKQSGGYIFVESEVGHGTLFSIYLPRTDGAPHGEQRSRVQGSRAGGSETVLLVEDDPAVREVASRVLRSNGYDVRVAASGEEAIALLEAGTCVDLVLTDAVMSGMHGAAVVEAARAYLPGVRALYMSGYTDDEVLRRGIVSSTVHFIHKPFRADDLASAVRRAIDEELPLRGE